MLCWWSVAVVSDRHQSANQQFILVDLLLTTKQPQPIIVHLLQVPVHHITWPW